MSFLPAFNPIPRNLASPPRCWSFLPTFNPIPPPRWCLSFLPSFDSTSSPLV
ncbi:uncharacterized protein C8R40DRAFT_1088638, partial [Lentinula edodes]|uniref:uncharacterized protein n=1 Tax=Lentinula edodes TaxID=5353 RepID=UPI001E8D36CA